MKKNRKLIVVGCLAIILVALAYTIVQAMPERVRLEQVALQDMNGVSHTLEGTGRPTILLFFTSWCPYCNEDAPKTVEMYNRYKDRLDLYGMNPANRDRIEDVRAYIENYRINYPVLLDENSKLYTQMKVPGFPTLVFFDKEGKEVERIVGATDAGRMEQAFVRLLNRH